MSDMQGPDMADIARQSSHQQASGGAGGGQPSHLTFGSENVRHGLEAAGIMAKKIGGFISDKASGLKHWMEGLSIPAKAKFEMAKTTFGQAVQNNGAMISSNSMSEGAVLGKAVPDQTPAMDMTREKDRSRG